MHSFLKKHIFLKDLNFGKYKILSILTSNILLILITIFYRNNPIIIQQINNEYCINFIFKNEFLENYKLVETLFEKFIYKKYNTNDYISFCLLESFLFLDECKNNIYLFKNELKLISFFNYEEIVDLY